MSSCKCDNCITNNELEKTLNEFVDYDKLAEHQRLMMIKYAESLNDELPMMPKNEE